MRILRKLSNNLKVSFKGDLFKVIDMKNCLYSL